MDFFLVIYKNYFTKPFFMFKYFYKAFLIFTRQKDKNIC